MSDKYTAKDLIEMVRVLEGGLMQPAPAYRLQIYRSQLEEAIKQVCEERDSAVEGLNEMTERHTSHE